MSKNHWKKIWNCITLIAFAILLVLFVIFILAVIIAIGIECWNTNKWIFAAYVLAIMCAVIVSIGTKGFE